MLTNTLLDAIAVAAELTQTQLSKAAARVMAEDLSRYPEHQVLAALTRCRRELKGRLSIAEIIARIDDGRPGAEEAWAMIPTDEGASVVWTDEMSAAFAVANPLVQEGDKIAARMAFLESYRTLVREARDASKPAHWTASLGHDVLGRERVLIEAACLHRLTLQHVSGLLPYRDQPPPEIVELLKLASPDLETTSDVREKLGQRLP